MGLNMTLDCTHLSTYRAERAWIGLILAAVLALGCHSSSEAPPAEGAVSLSPEKAKLRNNATSLLYDLLDDEKDVSKLFILKGGRDELKGLIRTIAKAAGAGQDKLKELAKKDPSLQLDVANLPPGEKATREAIAKTKQRELLHSSGADLEFNLLLTQADALGYGSHLAKIAAQNSVRADQIQEFNALSTTLDNLHNQVLALLRKPAK
jgi:hypothetical protein